MASIDRLKDGKYRARYRDPAGGSRSKTFIRKADASAFLASMDVKKRHGDWVPPELARVRFGDWAARWSSDQHHLTPATRARYDSLLRTQILPTWEAVRLDAIGYADTVSWVSGLTASGLSPSSVRQAHRVFSRILDLAVRDGRLSRNSAEGTPLPRVHKSAKRFLSHDQVHSLATACGPYRPLVLTLAYCGLRWGEAAALQVRDIDLMNRRLSVSRSVTEVSGVLVSGETKTHQRRSVPFPNFLREELMAVVAGRDAEAYVFASPVGGALRNNNFRHRCFDAAAAATGLAGLTPHELRHTAASLAVSSGANVKAVQRMLGHASAAMTLDVYAGLFADDLDSVAERLDEAAQRATVSRLCREDVTTVVSLHAVNDSQAV